MDPGASSAWRRGKRVPAAGRRKFVSNLHFGQEKHYHMESVVSSAIDMSKI